MLTPSVAGKYTVTVKIANDYTDAFSTIPTEINGSPFTVTCIEPSKEPVPDEPKKSSDTPTNPFTLLINWFLDYIIFVGLIIVLVYVIFMEIIKEPVPDEPKKSNDTPTDLFTLLINWLLDNWFTVVLAIALVYVSYLYFIKKPDPPKVDDKPKDDSSKDSLMFVILE